MSQRKKKKNQNKRKAKQSISIQKTANNKTATLPSNLTTKIFDRKFYKNTKVFISIIVIFIGLLGTYYSLKPRMIITQSQNLNPSKALSAYFEVSNVGYFKANNVEVFCKPHSIDLDYFKVLGEEDTRFLFGDNVRKNLSPNEKFNIQCGIDTDMLKNAKITIEVSYNSFFTLWQNESESQKFLTEAGEDGKLHWVAK